MGAFPGANRGLRELSAGLDGTLWFTESSTNQLGRLDLESMPSTVDGGVAF